MQVYIDPTNAPTFVFSDFFPFFFLPRVISVKKKGEGTEIHQYGEDIVLTFQELVLMCCSGLFRNSVGPYLTKYFPVLPPEIPRGMPMLPINSLRQNCPRQHCLTLANDTKKTSGRQWTVRTEVY